MFDSYAVDWELCAWIFGCVLVFFWTGLFACWFQSWIGFDPRGRSGTNERLPFGVTFWFWPVVLVILLILGFALGADKLMERLVKERN